MSDTDPLEQLEAANPFPANASSNPRPQRSPEALFKEITMNADTLTPSPHVLATAPATWRERFTRRAPRPSSESTVPWWRRPMTALPAMAAVAGIITVGAVVATSTFTSPSAEALVTTAAENAAAYDSGHVRVVIDLIEVPDEDVAGQAVFDYRYDRGDLAMVYDTSSMTFGDALETDVGMIEFRAVGDSVYTTYGNGTFTRSDRTTDLESTEALFGFNAKAIGPDTVVGLLERTADFEKVSSERGATVYRGTVLRADIEAIDPDDLPAGLSLLADGESDADDLPDELGIEVTVVDEVLTELVVQIDGETATGYAKATITSTFDGFGQTQLIVAPPADQVSEGSPTQIPESMREPIAVLDELDTRRPGLCSENFTRGDVITGEDEIRAEMDAFAACLEAAGESAAAAAFRELSTPFD